MRLKRLPGLAQHTSLEHTETGQPVAGSPGGTAGSWLVGPKLQLLRKLHLALPGPGGQWGCGGHSWALNITSHARCQAPPPGFFSHSPEAAQASQLTSLSSQGPVGPPTCSTPQPGTVGLLDRALGLAPACMRRVQVTAAHLLDVLLHCHGDLVPQGVVAHVDPAVRRQTGGVLVPPSRGIRYIFGLAVTAMAGEQTRAPSGAGDSPSGSCNTIHPPRTTWARSTSLP